MPTIFALELEKPRSKSGYFIAPSYIITVLYIFVAWILIYDDSEYCRIFQLMPSPISLQACYNLYCLLWLNVPCASCGVLCVMTVQWLLGTFSGRHLVDGGMSRCKSPVTTRHERGGSNDAVMIRPDTSSNTGSEDLPPCNDDESVGIHLKYYHINNQVRKHFVMYTSC